MAHLAAVWTKTLGLVSVVLFGFFLLIGQVRFSALSLAVTFAAISLARTQGALPATFWIRRARTDVVVSIVIAVVLATLALALPQGR